MSDLPTAPFSWFRPSQPTLPVLISAPHSGTLLPQDVMRALRAPLDRLRELDDGPVHELFRGAVEAGATMIVARYRRAFVDLNRDPLELDPDLAGDLPPRTRPRLSLRVRAGLGVVPSRLGTRPLYAYPLGSREIARRLHVAYYPYHRALREELAALRARFGVAVLLDVHSMPTSAASDGRRRVDLVAGDRYGRSAAASLVEAALAPFAAAGLAVARNRPFAGGYITENHGRPERGVHAIQLEIRRALFMDEQTHVLRCGAEALVPLVTSSALAVAEAARAVVVPSGGPTSVKPALPHPGSVAAD